VVIVAGSEEANSKLGCIWLDKFARGEAKIRYHRGSPHVFDESGLEYVDVMRDHKRRVRALLKAESKQARKFTSLRHYASADLPLTGKLPISTHSDHAVTVSNAPTTASLDKGNVGASAQHKRLHTSTSTQGDRPVPKKNDQRTTSRAQSSIDFNSDFGKQASKGTNDRSGVDHRTA
jgi:hypothetical protein